jgi:hypothetical protein
MRELNPGGDKPKFRSGIGKRVGRIFDRTPTGGVPGRVRRVMLPSGGQARGQLAVPAAPGAMVAGMVRANRRIQGAHAADPG